MDKIFRASEPVFIIGGGASLRGFDLEGRLFRRQRIAVNLAYRAVPKAEVLFFSDDRFFRQHEQPMEWRFGKGRILTTAPACQGKKGRITYIPPKSLTLRVGKMRQAVTGMCSGAQAIALAYQLGAREIVLLGFDNAPGHWAEGKPYMHERLPDPDVYAGYAEQFEKIARLGIDITNATPGTALTCFPTAKPEKYL